MLAEARQRGGVGINGVSNELIFHGTNLEFLAIGSCVNRDGDQTERFEFSTSADGQALYCQVDSGFTPKQFVFGNVAYSIGLGGGILGSLRSLARGEVSILGRIYSFPRFSSLMPFCWQFALLLVHLCHNASSPRQTITD